MFSNFWHGMYCIGQQEVGFSLVTQQMSQENFDIYFSLILVQHHVKNPKCIRPVIHVPIEIQCLNHSNWMSGSATALPEAWQASRNDVLLLCHRRSYKAIVTKPRVKMNIYVDTLAYIFKVVAWRWDDGVHRPGTHRFSHSYGTIINLISNRKNQEIIFHNHLGYEIK